MQIGLPFEPDAGFSPEAVSPVPSNPAASGLALRFVRHPRARRYVIRVGDDGAVRVTIPRGGSRRAAEEFVEGERTWIHRERRRAAERQAAAARSRSAIADWDGARERARRELRVRLRELADAHGVAFTKVSIRNQHSRWGSCSRSGTICLNWRLVLMPAWIRDYVIVHELMHLRRMDHSPRFWRLVGKICPEYRSARAWLREHAYMLDDQVSADRSGAEGSA